MLLEACLAAGDSLVLDGPRGIGKSALLDALGAAARARGELVLRASGAEAERWMGYQGLADLLGQVPDEHFAALTSQHRLALRAVRRGKRSGGDGRARVVRRLAWHALLTHCAARTPVLLIIDDAHWLDAATADVFAYAARRLDGLAVRVVLADRGSEAGHRPHALAPPPVTEATVPPLTAADLAELLDPHGLSARATMKIHADSAGNPYLALALAACSDGREVPRLRALTQDKLLGLSDQVRETLLVCALAARPSMRLLLRAGRDEAEADIAAAAEAGLLVSDGVNLRFTPPDAATVVAQSIPAARRSQLHLDLAEVATSAAEAERHRALACADPDEEVARSLVAAAEAAVRGGARALGAELYLLAADRTPPALESLRIDWLVAAAEVGATAGVPEIVHHAVETVLGAETEPAQRFRARIALMYLAGQGVALLEETVAAAFADAEGDPAAMAFIQLWRSWASMVAGSPRAADDDAALAVEHARAAGAAGTEAMAHAVRAQARNLLGHKDYATFLDRGLALAVPAADGYRHLGPRFTAARFAILDDRLDEAREDLLRMLALVERGAAEEHVAVLCGLAEVAAKLGRCRESLDFANRAMRISGEAGLSPGPAWCAGAIAELAGGNLIRARSYAERGIVACRQEVDTLYELRLLHLLAQVDLRCGEIAGGVGALRRIQEFERAHGWDDPTTLRRHGDMVAGLIALGEPEEADELISSVRRVIAARPHGPGMAATLDRAEAAVCAAKGDYPTAMRLLTSAKTTFAVVRQPIEHGHCLLVEAKVERRRRHYTAARVAAEAALELFTAAGAQPWIEESRALIVRLAEIGDTGGALTASEARIAAMAGEGATNQEIADQLFLSRKTVEATLTRIYRKLGIRSRAQLIRHIHVH
ncbi:AAA ATPase domain-containing protein [Actinokineospora alba]|uniref:AAA ATPase domain-containing protein n=1 Tax=Actinokineospora alba TaxID=504798 RepID=A0A1H0W9G7_9PSEU|nr:LuxR family transcriptional regulator [Actinokineospora alba]SDJ43339.1 AAA ATPase domain-containing protein [Actinokineospora alba]SDP87278.1 AAA ATPase domain-containing protein [Actinokineospora alba]